MRNGLIFLVLTASLASASSAHAVKIADLTRMSGQRTNWMTGMGLVVGLKNTGDGGDYLPATRSLATLLEKFHNGTANLKDLTNAQNVAIVLVTATIGKDGVHQGDRLDVTVSCMGDAKSLQGGTLFVTPMTGPLGGEAIYALAEGAVTPLEGTPTTGVIRQGAQMEADFFVDYMISDGKFQLILEDSAADWTTAWSIAKVINDAMNERGEELAVVKDPKTVEVTIPMVDRERPDSFIGSVQRLPVKLLPTEARVVINRAQHSITLSGNVEISPTVIIYQGLTISTQTPPPVGTPGNPLVTTKTAVGLATTGTDGARIEDLVSALDQLKVSADDRINIIMQLHDHGNLHAKLILE